MSDKKIKGYECRFAIHSYPKDSSSKETKDVHMVKEVIHYEDGTTKPNIRLVYDFKFPYWVTKKHLRNFKQKKETEDLNNLDVFYTTNQDSIHNIRRSLGLGFSKYLHKTIMSSPYLFGRSVTSTSQLKRKYMDKYPDLVTPYGVAVLDIESDVIGKEEKIIIITLAYKNKSVTTVLKSFVEGIEDPILDIKTAENKYIKEYLDKRSIETEIILCDNEVELIKKIFDKAHEWKPDFIAIWEINYDIPKILSTLEKYNVNPEDIFCDPAVPENIRKCSYKEGRYQKQTSIGNTTSMDKVDRWHTLSCNSSFYIIDAACVYRIIRLAKPREPSYSLDNILNKELGLRKLKFKETEMYTGLQLHKIMQTKYKIEYIIYNIFDCLSILELDDKTKDMSNTMPAFSGSTDFWNFNSQPVRITDDLHYFCLSKNKVLSTGSVGFKNDLPEPLDLKNWILIVPPHLSSLGIRCIKEDDKARSNIRCFVFAPDMVSAYPSVISSLNVSIPTTRREVVSMDGIEEEIFRRQNLNLIYGEVNSVEYCSTMFKFKKPENLLSDFLKN